MLILEQLPFRKIKVTLGFQSYIFRCLLANYKIYVEHLAVYVVFRYIAIAMKSFLSPALAQIADIPYFAKNLWFNCVNWFYILHNKHLRLNFENLFHLFSFRKEKRCCCQMFGLWLPDGLLFRAGAKRPAITMMPNCESGTHVDARGATTKSSK